MSEHTDDMKRLVEDVRQTLTGAGYAPWDGEGLGFKVTPNTRTGQVKVELGFGMSLPQTARPTELIAGYRRALVYADKFDVYDTDTAGLTMPALTVEHKAPAPILAPTRYELHERRGMTNTLDVRVGGVTIGTITHASEPGGRTGWVFAGDPSRGLYGVRETAATAVLLVKQLRDVLRYHVDEEGVYENAIVTALAALQSYPATDGRGAVKIFRH